MKRPARRYWTRSPDSRSITSRRAPEQEFPTSLLPYPGGFKGFGPGFVVTNGGRHPIPNLVDGAVGTDRRR